VVGYLGAIRGRITLAGRGGRNPRTYVGTGARVRGFLFGSFGLAFFLGAATPQVLYAIRDWSLNVAFSVGTSMGWW
jgi:hypothetical protein